MNKMNPKSDIMICIVPSIDDLPYGLGYELSEQDMGWAKLQEITQGILKAPSGETVITLGWGKVMIACLNCDRILISFESSTDTRILTSDNLDIELEYIKSKYKNDTTIKMTDNNGIQSFSISDKTHEYVIKQVWNGKLSVFMVH